MNKTRNVLVYAILLAGLLITGAGLAATVPNDPPDSSAYVGCGWNGFLPAFKDANGVSIPFIPTRILTSIGYQGDFYVNEFTDAKIKHAWQELKSKEPDVAQKISAEVSANTDETALNSYRITGWLDPKGAVNGNDTLKLVDIRRPKFFGQAPYFEDISKAEQNTYTVEFTVPRDPYERLQLKMTTPVKLRGWFIKGDGVLNAEGKRIHALVIYSPGSTEQPFAIEHPNAPYYVYNVQTKKYESVPFPNKNLQSERRVMRQLRQFFYGFNQVGFDLLVVDKRGHGVSGGVNGNNSAEMAEDVFRMLDQLESGNGLTVLAPNGQLLQGKQTSGLLLRGISAKQVPVLLAGGSQGAIISLFAMHKNYVGWTAFNEPSQKFSLAKKYNIKTALLFDDFVGGLGYVSDSSFKGVWGVYQEAVLRVEKYTMRQPTSEILANIDKWPAVFFGHGLWDSLQSAEGTYEAYQRAKGLKELVFVRGGHGLGAWGAENRTYMINKMTEFAVRVLVNPNEKYPELKSFKEAVLSSPPYWEPSSRP
jgi:hypothetical protein